MTWVHAGRRRQIRPSALHRCPAPGGRHATAQRQTVSSPLPARRHDARLARRRRVPAGSKWTTWLTGAAGEATPGPAGHAHTAQAARAPSQPAVRLAGGGSTVDTGMDQPIAVDGVKRRRSPAREGERGRAERVDTEWRSRVLPTGAPSATGRPGGWPRQRRRPTSPRSGRQSALARAPCRARIGTAREQQVGERKAVTRADGAATRTPSNDDRRALKNPRTHGCSRPARRRRSAACARTICVPEHRLELAQALDRDREVSGPVAAKPTKTADIHARQRLRQRRRGTSNRDAGQAARQRSSAHSISSRS